MAYYYEQLEQLRIAGILASVLDRARKEKENIVDDDDDLVCCPLPFPLQDLCLLVVMSNLGSYPKELLASLPLWLRRRLLHILPLLDLCHLEHTSVADGVDVEAIWKSRSKLDQLKPHEGKDSEFQLEISNYSIISRFLKEEIKSDMDQCSVSPGERILLSAVSNILTSFSKSGKKVNSSEPTHHLISIEGEYVFSNLLSGSAHEPCQTSQCGQRVWKSQATALAVHHPPEMPYRTYHRRDEKILLIPHHLQVVSKQLNDPLKLLSFLTKKYDLQPSNAFVDIDSIYSLLCSEMLILDSGSSLPPEQLIWTPTINHILGKVSVLGLQCSDYSKFRVMMRLMEVALETLQLRHLLCATPNLYREMMKPFSTLFSLQTFHQLTLEVDKMCPITFSKLLLEFMTAPCTDTKKLKISVNNDTLFPTSLEANQLGVLYKGQSLSVPPCSVQHKLLQFSSEKQFTRALPLLLQFPTIRLKEIILVDLHEYYEYLHLCTLHPDLQTTKLIIDIPSGPVYGKSSIDTFLSTFRADLISLLGIPSLEKIFISGIWGKLDEIKLGLVRALSCRSRSHPLKKITLELLRSDNYKMQEFQMLCEAIFSLPQLHNLKIVLGKGFVDMIKQSRYEDVMYQSWIRRSSKVQLKSICLQSQHEIKFMHLSTITQKVTFAPPKFTYFARSSYNMWLDDCDDDLDSLFGYYGGGYVPDYMYDSDDYY